jgi:hypothetical protein
MIHHRALTHAEIEALPPGLLAAVPSDEVVLIASHHPLSHLSQALRGYALIVVRGRRIFWPGLVADMSGDCAKLSVLAHELVHVWQYETGMTLVKYVWRDVIRRLGRYAYRLTPGKPFTAYGYEQQAAMMEDWMRLRHGLFAHYGRSNPPGNSIDMAALEAVVPFL